MRFGQTKNKQYFIYLNLGGDGIHCIIGRR